MKPGDVLFHKDYKFDDGDTSDKLLIVLAAAPPHEVMVVLTTSQQHRRELRDGCHTNPGQSYFTFNANPGGFKKTTWVLLTPRLMFVRALELKMDSGQVKPVQSLRETDLRAVINCLKKSDDVSPFHLSLLK